MIRASSLAGALCAVLLAPAQARAHPLALGVLVVREHAGGEIDTSFRFSGTEARATGAEPVLPARCRAVGLATERALEEGGTSRDARFDCGARGLSGETLAVRGLEGSGVQIVVRIERADGSVVEALLDDGTRALAVAGAPDRSVIADHIALGVEHIALGIDHLLFVLALMLVVRGRRALLLTITAFTIGHSLTLALAALGAIALPPAPVEACIAASILVVALEAHAGRETARPWALAGAFGLLHGLGFAGALAERGLPRDAIAPALVGFNVGVELGQIAFVALVLAAIAVGARSRIPGRPARAASVLTIGAVATYFLLDRATMLGSSS